jgi:hypothetical protein
MTSRKTWRIVIVVLLLIACLLLSFIAKVAYDVHQLSFYRTYIENHFVSEISLVEEDCKSFPLGDIPDREWPRLETAAKIIESKLSSKAIFCVYSSGDGHHGQRCLKPMKDGFTSYCIPFCGSNNSDGRHTLFFGKTFNGQRLLVYQGVVPTGGKRRYEIVFLLDEIRNAAEKK